MSRYTRKSSKKAGLSPGSLVFVGEKKIEKTRIRLINYNESKIEEKELEKIEDAFPFKNSSSITWVNIDGLHDTSIIEKIGNQFKVHPLVLEDILNTNQRPKIDDYDDYLYIVFRMVQYGKQEQQISTEQVSLITGKNFVISFQEKEGDVFDPIRERLRNNKGRIRKERSDYLAYTLLDAVVDSYFVVLEDIGEAVEDLEDELITDPQQENLHSIHKLRREMILLRKSVWPLREVINNMERGDSDLIQDSTQVFLRDIYDHTIQIIETIESLRDMISGMLDTYLSSLSNKMNEVMKVLTIIATIFIPLTFITGIYGMNFEHMPELKWVWFYPFVFWLLIIVIAGLMLFYFKRKNWL